jgi:hypothetical protein
MNATMRVALLLLLGLAFLPAGASPASHPPEQAGTTALPLGCWHVNGNGHRGQLCIPSVNPDGTFTGTMTLEENGVNSITGFWSSDTEQISFLRYITKSDPTSYQSYIGFMYPEDFLNPLGPQRLAGTFNVFGPEGGSTSTRNLWGWNADHP